MEEYEKLNMSAFNRPTGGITLDDLQETMLEGTGSEKPGFDGQEATGRNCPLAPIGKRQGRFMDPEKRKNLGLIILFWIIFSSYYLRRMIRFKVKMMLFDFSGMILNF